MDFRFYKYSDEEIEECISVAKKEITSMIREREFDIEIMTMGLTLIQLEEEKNLRKIRH